MKDLDAPPTINEADIRIIKRALLGDFEELRAKMFEDLENRSAQIFEKGRFMRRFEQHVIKIIEGEVRSKINNDEVHRIIGDALTNNIKNNLGELIRRVVIEVVNNTNRRLSRELEITKKLTYSIDAEIRHTLATAPISYEIEKNIHCRIMELLRNNKNILKIEHKNSEGG